MAEVVVRVWIWVRKPRRPPAHAFKKFSCKGKGPRIAPEFYLSAILKAIHDYILVAKGNVNYSKDTENRIPLTVITPNLT